MENKQNTADVSTIASATLSKLGIAHKLNVDVTKLPTDAAFRRAETLLAFAAGTHRNGAAALWDKEDVNTAEYIRGIRASAESTKGYRIGEDDKRAGADLLKRLTDLGITEAWGKKQGIEPTLENLIQYSFAKRVKEAEAKKAEEAAREAAELAELKKLMS
jgi:hypothetical protein